MMEMPPDLTPAQRIVIRSLSALVAEKRQLVHSLGMTQSPRDEADRMRLSMAYSQAQADLWNAQDALAAAIRKG